MHVLFDFLDFVIVLFLSGVFEYKLFFMVEGLVGYKCKRHLCAPRKLVRRAKNQGWALVQYALAKGAARVAVVL